MRLFSSTSRDAKAIKTKLDPFGKVAHNPVRDMIAELREMRDAGTLSDADYVNEVAVLLGTSEGMPSPLAR
jgi:hypothetical protein